MTNISHTYRRMGLWGGLTCGALALSLCLCGGIIWASSSRSLAPQPDPLLGTWVCVDRDRNCLAGVDTILDDMTWTMSDTITFATEGELTYGESLWRRDGTMASGNLTCEYQYTGPHALWVYCGLGAGHAVYTITGDRLRFEIFFRVLELRRAPSP